MALPEFVSCPLCGQKAVYAGNPFRPFCSERCKMIDLGTWATEGYAIAGSVEEDGEQDPETGSSQRSE